MKHDLTTWVSEFLTACQAGGLSPRTIDWYRGNLARFQRFAQAQRWKTITPRELRVFLAHLREKHPYSDHPTRPTESGGLSVYTIAGYVRTFKRFFGWLAREGMIDANPAADLKVPRFPKAVPRAISIDNVIRLLAAADNSRDRALVWFLIDTGCRRGELCGLRWDAIKWDANAVLVRGKGNRERFVFLGEPTIEVLQTWRSVQSPASKYIFTGPKGPLTVTGIYQALKRLKEKAGVNGRSNPHAFRHAFGQEWVRSGGDLPSLCAIMGHSDVKVTMIYTLLPSEDRQEKHRLHSPVVRLSEALKQLDKD